LFPWLDNAKLAAPRFQVHVLVQDVVSVPVHDVVPAYGEFCALAAGSLKAFTVSFEPTIDALVKRAFRDLDFGSFLLLCWHIYSVSGTRLNFQWFWSLSAYVLETSSIKVLTNSLFLVKHQMRYSQTISFEYVAFRFLLSTLHNLAHPCAT